MSDLLQSVCELLGWQGGTIHQVIDEVKRLKDENRRLRAVIDELPEFIDGVTYECWPNGGLKNIIKFSCTKSSLLAKHGVEG